VRTLLTAQSRTELAEKFPWRALDYPPPFGLVDSTLALRALELLSISAADSSLAAHSAFSAFMGVGPRIPIILV
jgi:hypothetical protein